MLRKMGLTPLETMVQPLRKKMFLTGFTLIEFIVVIAIIAVLSAVGIVSFSSLTGDKLTSDARKLVNDLCWARQMAVARNQNYIIDFNTTSERYSIYNTSISPANQLKIQILSPGIDLVSVTPAAPVVFNTFSFPKPASIATNSNITLSAQGKTATVQVFNTTGYVKIQ
jgi:prepilin-type N-terminal cleavage/methylation domain-containing protein